MGRTAAGLEPSSCIIHRKAFYLIRHW